MVKPCRNNDFLCVAVNHVMNGPFDLSKVTHYEGVGDAFVRCLLTGLSQAGWTHLLLLVKEYYETRNIVIPCKMMSECVEYYGNYFKSIKRKEYLGTIFCPIC